MIENWVWKSNWEPVLAILASRVGYDFSLDDVEAIYWGIGGTNSETGPWYEYQFPGQRAVSLKLAQDVGTGLVSIRLEGDPEIEQVAGIVMDIAQQYFLSKAGRE